MDLAAILNAQPAILPPLVFAGLWRLLSDGRREWQRAFLIASALCGLLVVVVNEGLSPLAALTRPAVVAVWVLAEQGVLVALVLRWRRCTSRVKHEGDRPWLTWGLIALLGVPMAALLLGVGVIAVVSPPTNWDSMTYHLARVVNWEQYRSIWHYPTHIGRQIYMPPLAEWMILHLQLLAGSDRFANAVQWAGLAGCLVAASSVARSLGAGRTAQWAAAALTFTIPMAIEQGSTTQNDVMISFWLIAFVALVLPVVLRPFSQEDPHRLAAPLAGREIGETRPASGAAKRWAFYLSDGFEFVPAGLALGLALLTKGTGLLFAPPLVLMAVGFLIRRRRWRAGVPILAVALIALTIPLGHWARNTLTCGSPFGPGREDFVREQGSKYASDLHAPSIIASTLLRNTSLQFRLPDLRHLTGRRWWDRPIGRWFRDRDLTNPARDFNDAVKPWVVDWHVRHGLNPDNPLTNWKKMPYDTGGDWNSEDNAGAPLHTLLIAAAVVILPFRRPRVGGRALLLLLAALAGLVLFAAVLRWQPWHNRLTLPGVVLAMPVVAVALEALLTPLLLGPAMLALLVASTPWVVNNSARPMFASTTTDWFGRRSIFVMPRDAERFVSQPWNYGDYQRVATAIASADPRATVGLRTGVDDDWEYPLWVLLRERGWTGRLVHVGVANDSVVWQTPADRDARPDAVVVVRGSRIRLERPVGGGK